MIVVLHNHNKVVSVFNFSTKENINFSLSKISNVLYEVAKQYRDELIVWCHSSLKNFINESGFTNIFHHKLIMASYNFGNSMYLPKEIGFVDSSIFVKVNKKIHCATWLMSSNIGGIYAEVLNTTLKDVKRHLNFNYFINSVAKVAMQQGLFCYSSPQLLLKNTPYILDVKQASKYTLFKFVKQHYKRHWIIALLLSFVFFEKKFPFFPFLSSFLYQKKNYDLDFSKIELESKRKVIHKKEVDVVIPTIGRKLYLYDVLKDLSKQTILPKNVIIVEQNPKENSVSELDYLKNEPWPFNIRHKFINQTGVCNARNMALNLVESEWTLLGDDDNRFDPDLIEKFFEETEKTGLKVGTSVYLKPDEKQTYFKRAQTPIFAGGNSFIKSDIIKKVKFNLNFEHNYGEDHEFGMQIRALGEDIIFYPNVKITHLKAPFGGFRTNVSHPWSNEEKLPKPSPTLMLLYLKSLTKQQLQGYKLLLFIRFYKNQPIKNPYSYIKNMQKRWGVSLVWAHKLNKSANA